MYDGVLELGIRALRKDSLTGSGQQGVLCEPPCWSSMLARITQFLLPYLLPSPSRRTHILVPKNVSWSAIPRDSCIQPGHICR